MLLPRRASAAVAAVATTLAMALLAMRAAAQAPFAVNLRGACATRQQRFDSANLTCVPCGADQAAAPGGVGGSASVSGEVCICDRGFRREQDAGTNDVDAFTCVSCAALQLASLRDSSRCVACDATTQAELNVTRRDCVCLQNLPTQGGPGYALVETNAAGQPLSAKQCVPCPNHTRVFPNEDPYFCRPCKHPAQVMAADGSCSCGAGFLQAGDTCVRADLLASLGVTATTVLFRDLRSTDTGRASTRELPSSLFADTYAAVAVACREERVRAACHALANMCALEKFAPERVPCAKFAEVNAAVPATSHGFATWKHDLPQLSFLDRSVLDADVLASLVSLERVAEDETRARVSSLRFSLVKFALNGTYLGAEPLGSQLQLCRVDPDRAASYLRFGVAFEAACSLHLHPLLSAPEPVFYELYLVDRGGAVFPVPVAVSNFRGPAGALFRRFFLYDNVSSRPRRGEAAEALVFAQRITLRVRMVDGSSERIHPPLLEIEYAEREAARISASELNSQSVSRVSFAAEYSKDLSGLWLAAAILFALSLVLVAALWLRRLYVWQRYNQYLQIDFSFLVRGAIFAMGVLGEVFFWLAVILAAYMFIFYKGQATAFFLLPPRDGDEVRLLTTFLALAFCGKLLDLAYTLWRQITIDIFFIDWEKPRGTLSEAAFQSERARRAPGDPATAAAAAASATFGRTRGSLGGGTEDDGGGGGPDVADSAAMAERKDDSSEVPLPVSVWRRVFVINKFNELQSARQVDISLTLFWLLLFLRGLGLEYLATAQPSASDLDPDAAPLHPLLRFAVAIFFWLLVAGCQIVLRFAVYNRYLRDAAAQFVDLLCSTNVSCLILDHRYHGWYIHGKSVHAHADTSLEEMNLQIAYEQRNWTKPRGLVEGKDAFELLVSRQFRARYDKIYSSLLAKELQRRQTARRRGAQGLSARERQAIEVAGARLGAAGGAGGGGGGGAGGATLEIDSEKTLLLSDRLMAASAALNEFLKSFVEKHEPQHFPWEEGFRTFFERRFGLPPTVQQDSLVSFFFEDAGLDFTRTLLMGIERDVILFLIIFYALADLAFGNTFVSVLLTYLCDRAITAARAHWGRINLSQKTLIDDRFLL